MMFAKSKGYENYSEKWWDTKDDFMNYKNSSFEDLQKLLREDEKKFDEIHIFLLIFK